MAYPIAFFAPQVRLARLLAERFNLGLSEALLRYTTVAPSLGIADEEWPAMASPLLAAEDLAAALHAEYERRRPPDVTPGDPAFHGRPLFGCFSYAVREGGVIRPHFVANDLPDLRPHSAERVAARRAELRQLFAHVQAHVPEATTALGNSWLYNVAAYRRLFPAAYTAHMPASDEDEFQYLALWGQCYDRAWQPRPDIVSALFERVAMLTELASLRHCFSYQILQPKCLIRAFYTEYGLEMGASAGAGASPG
jgi:hypothetical protein